MPITALVLFGVAVTGIVALFGLKAYEYQHGILFAARPRRRADVYAIAIKILAQSFGEKLEHLPGLVASFGRFMVHIGALGFAKVARAAERSAYKIADRVSHRHRFERGETRSQFLRSVSEHKSSLDTRL